MKGLVSFGKLNKILSCEEEIFSTMRTISLTGIMKISTFPHRFSFRLSSLKYITAVHEKQVDLSYLSSGSCCLIVTIYRYSL